MEQCRLFDEQEAVVEDAIENLWRRFPRNNAVSDVLLKVVVLIRAC